MIKPSKRLQIVLKLAKLNQQRAAERLGESVRAAEACQQQTQQLVSYQQDYNLQFGEQGKQPVNAQQLNNYLLFFNSLDNVVNIQQQQNLLAEQNLEQSRLHWQQMYSRQKNMQTLINDKRMQEEREQENKQQRILDDRATNNKDKY